ncbi:MAG: hypothetical protein ACE5WD_10600 [Candidatus Aminicenantia bacterium]
MVKKINSSKKAEIEIYIEGEKIPLNPFVSKIIKNTFKGMLSSLRGFRKGEIKIIIPKE